MGEETMIPQVSQNISITPMGASFQPTVSYEEWEQVMVLLQRNARGINWCLGDALNFGEMAYGEKYAQAIELTDLSYNSLSTIAWVCKNIPEDIRHEGLSFTHHRAVAQLEVDDQVIFLSKASSQGMTCRELKEEVAVFIGGPEILKRLEDKKEKKEKDPDLEAYTSNPMVGLESIARECKKVKFTAVPTKDEIQRMALCITNVKRLCSEYGIEI